jgi:hypothetical protein
MAKQIIGIGSVPNDGNGDPLRTAFSKVNDNFNEMYSSFDMSGKLTVGNSTVNSSVSNTSGFRTGNSTFITVANSTTIQIANSSGTANLTPTALNVGANVIVNTTGLFVGNSSVNTTINSTAFTGTANNSNYLGSVAAASYVQNNASRTLSGNLYFTGTNNVFAANTVKIGTSTIAANGYTYLPNGLKMNWGVVSANSSDGNISFTSAFSTAVYSIIVSGTNTEVTTIPAVVDANTTAALIRTSNATSVNVYFTAIGS